MQLLIIAGLFIALLALSSYLDWRYKVRFQAKEQAQGFPVLPAKPFKTGLTIHVLAPSNATGLRIRASDQLYMKRHIFTILAEISLALSLFQAALWWFE